MTVKRAFSSYETEPDAMTMKDTIKMLSIDDKSLTTDLDRAGYRKMGVFVRPAANFEETEKLLKKETIDLVVINMDYPPIDAELITKHLKAQDEYKHIPVVCTSVQTTGKVRNSALNAGADLFVEQPLPRQYFIEKLKQLLEQQTRTTERLDFHGEVTFTCNDYKETCPIGDLSASGMLLSTDSELEDGAPVKLEFSVPGYKKPIKADGEVVRTIKSSDKFPERKTGVGIRFTDFQGDSQKRLERYISKNANQAPQMVYYL